MAPSWAAPLLVLICLALYLPGLAGLPPMDRDEPRFAQASKQMLETGDYVGIRFQDEARNKKPVGIYWLQVAAVTVGQALGVADARRTIWLYRLPSLIGAIGAVLATYWTGLAVTTRRAAGLAAALFASTVILTAEAHLAKTDAVLCATVVLAMGSLIRVHEGARREERPSLALAVVFWTAIGLGILVKGPITPMVPALAAIALCVKERSAGWLRRLRPGLGLAWVLLIVMPWLVLILLRTHGAFLSDSVGGDMLGKATGGREAHGAPPGAYLLAFWVTAWPLAPFAAVAAPGVWRRRAEPAVVALLAWLVPTWLVFELVPTKLPHYVLPVYPAVAILAAMVLDEQASAPARPRWQAAVFAALLAVLPAGLLAALVAGRGLLWSTLPPAALTLGILVVLGTSGCALWSARSLARGHVPSAVAAAVVAAFAINAFTLGELLNPRVSDLLALSGRVAEAGEDAVAPDCRPGAFASVGDHEPSLVFLTGTNLLLADAAQAAAFVNAAGCRGAFVESRSEPAFRAALGEAPDVRLARRVQGTDLNGGKHLDIGIYVRQRSAP